MKISFRLGPNEPLSRQTAWGCLTTNVAVPGSGSLMAGRRVGYPQLILTLLGMGMTIVFGIPCIIWFLRNRAALQAPSDDPFNALYQILLHVRWASLGIAIFAFAWLWALMTSLVVLQSAKKAEAGDVPPIMDGRKG